MKTLLLIASFAVFAFAGYYFTNNLKYSTDLNYIIYMSIWFLLIVISAIGVIYHFPVLIRQRRVFRNLIYNSYSERRTPNREFDRHFHILS